MAPLQDGERATVMEVIQEAFAAVNLLPTVLLLLMVVYWITVIIGALDLDFLNVDLDTDIQADMDLDVDADMDADLEGGLEAGGGWLHTLLAFIYVGEVPVMILLTIFALSAWFVSLMANHYLNPDGSWLIAMAFIVPNLILSVLAVKVLGRPFVWVFRGLNKDYNVAKDVIGSECTVITSKVSSRMGQAEVATRGAPILLNCRTVDGTVLRKGDRATVVRIDSGRGVYIVSGLREAGAAAET